MLYIGLSCCTPLWSILSKTFKLKYPNKNYSTRDRQCNFTLVNVTHWTRMLQTKNMKYSPTMFSMNTFHLRWRKYFLLRYRIDVNILPQFFFQKRFFFCVFTWHGTNFVRMGYDVLWICLSYAKSRSRPIQKIWVN